MKNNTDYIVSYSDLKQAVEWEWSLDTIIERTSVSQPKHIIIDMYKKAKEELWYEQKRYTHSKMGTLIYV